MTGKLIAPDYHIRLFSRKRGLLNLNNVLSVSVTETVNDVGNFSITLDYREGLKEQTIDNPNPINLIHDLEPMDYIEVFMRNKIPSRKDGTPITYGQLKGNYENKDLPVGFGVFDKDGNYRPFEYLYNFETKMWEYEKDPYKQKPLDILEKINNPDFVFCGFVRSIADSGNMSGGNPSAQIVISGEGVGTFLKMHQLYFGSITETLNAKLFNSQTYTSALRIEETIKYILGDLTARSLETGFEYAVDGTDKEKGRFYNKGDDYKQEGTVRILDEEDGGSIRIYRERPSFNHIYWSEFKGTNLDIPNAIAPWGRISRIQYGRGVTKHNITAMESAWESIVKNAGVPFNEFWVDRTGNVVLRRMIDAATEGYPSEDFNEPGQEGFAKVIDPNSGEENVSYVWTDIDTSEIISWNINKSDFNLKTMIIGNLELDTSGQSGPLVDFIRAPITEGMLKAIIDKLVNVQAVDGGVVSLLKNIQANQLAGISLITEEGLKEFFQRYGVRTESFLNFTSQNFVDGWLDTFLLFLYRLFNLYTGTITIIGNPQIKAGTTIYVKRLNATFYVTSVTHDYTFGEGIITQLTIENGRIQEPLGNLFTKIRDVQLEQRERS